MRLRLNVSLLGTGATTDVLAVNTSLANDTWHHVAVTWNGGTKTAKFYVNGSQVGTDQVGTLVSSLFNDNQPFNVGATSAGGNFADGKFSLWRAWNVVRTQAEIAANICNVFGGSTSGLVGEWSFNNVYTDASGNNNTLTPVGSPVFTVDVPAVCVPIVQNTGFFMFMPN